MSRTIADRAALRDRAAQDTALDGQARFPVRETKVPAVRGWNRASADELLRSPTRLWELVGMRTGGMIGATGLFLAVVDVDPRNGGRVDPAWPETLTVQTRSGGWHLYFATASPVRNSAGVVAPGVDVRGLGGFVVVPPSDGYRYVNAAPVAEMPAAMFAVSRERAHGGRGRGRGFEPRMNVGPGERNDYLASCAGWLFANGLDDGEVREELHEVNASCCRPPVEDAEVDAIVRSIARYHVGRVA